MKIQFVWEMPPHLMHRKYFYSPTILGKSAISVPSLAMMDKAVQDATTFIQNGLNLFYFKMQFCTKLGRLLTKNLTEIYSNYNVIK